MFLATPYRGRAIPFSFVTYLSRTIGAEMSSRNIEHIKRIGELKELLGDKILALDREELAHEGFGVKMLEGHGQKLYTFHVVQALNSKPSNSPGELSHDDFSHQ